MKNNYKKAGETREKTRGKTREKIIALIKENKSITTEELANKLGITAKGIEWNIQNLKSQGVLKRTGPDKGGHWEIVNEKNRGRK